MNAERLSLRLLSCGLLGVVVLIAVFKWKTKVSVELEAASHPTSIEASILDLSRSGVLERVIAASDTPTTRPVDTTDLELLSASLEDARRIVHDQDILTPEFRESLSALIEDSFNLNLPSESEKVAQEKHLAILSQHPDAAYSLISSIFDKTNQLSPEMSQHLVQLALELPPTEKRFELAKLAFSSLDRTDPNLIRRKELAMADVLQLTFVDGLEDSTQSLVVSRIMHSSNELEAGHYASAFVLKYPSRRELFSRELRNRGTDLMELPGFNDPQFASLDR